MSHQPSLRLSPATFGTSCRLLRYIFAPPATPPGEAIFRFVCLTIALHHPVTAALAFEKKSPAAGLLHARYAIAANPEKVPRCGRDVTTSHIDGVPRRRLGTVCPGRFGTPPSRHYYPGARSSL